MWKGGKNKVRGRDPTEDTVSDSQDSSSELFFSDWEIPSDGSEGQRRPRPFKTREEVREFFRVFNNPGPEIIDEAVGIVAEECSPLKIYVYGPTAYGYVDDRHVILLVVVKRGDTDKIEKDLLWALADRFIDGDVTVVTRKGFEEFKDNSYSRVYDAVKTGYVAYSAEV